MLHHVALETLPQDADAAVAFWALLGFDEVHPPPPLHERSRWVERGSTQIHLLFTDDAEAPKQGHAAVIAHEFDAACRAIEAAGHPLEHRPAHWGADRAFATAPGGHRVELMAAPPGGFAQN
jgi:catechol 2,3-dioxygenase-like lactoylglutathione lyase family enzyme